METGALPFRTEQQRELAGENPPINKFNYLHN
jgi:hypothetical protein